MTEAANANPAGSLIVVGTGIRLVGQTTLEARAHIESAEKVLYLVADPATRYWIEKLNSSAESLDVYYKEGKDRLTTYLEMVDQVMHFVRSGLKVCAVFYGHPGVFVYPSHEVIKRARAEGIPAMMLPGVSAEDCLFADLGIDPGSQGCQSFEATDFLIYRRKFDPLCSLILWQIGVIGDIAYKTRYSCDGLRVLVETLAAHYDIGHEVAVYEAAQYPVCAPKINVLPIRDLPEVPVTPISTLFIPPKAQSFADPDMVARLGIPLCAVTPEPSLSNA